MKIAILIIIHKNQNQSSRLINYLSKNFDVYVHIDKKSNINLKEQENVFIYNKYEVYWGDFSQIKTTLLLLEEAFKKCYDRYILISGQDLPIKQNKEILEFYKYNRNEYIQFFTLPNKIWGLTKWGGLDRIYKKHVRINNKYYDKGINPYFNSEIIYYGGSNWFDLTNSTLETILSYLSKNPEYLNIFKYSLSGDEIFFQTLIKLLKIDNLISHNLRYIDWNYNYGFSKILCISDYNKIMNSDCLFARKFDETVDNEIIDKIYEHIGENK
jgi:hypothetical protein